MNGKHTNRCTAGFLFLLIIISGCGQKPISKQNISNTILNEQSSFFYLNAENYPSQDNTLPIGVFDSGTGGLTVLDAIVNFDQHQNSDHQFSTNGDGVRDFQSEYFIYLGDQANMPYGNYPRENNVGLLKEHIIKDMQFLLGTKYYRSGDAPDFETDKQPVKSIVIACNTATAYGKKEIEKFLKQAHIDLKVIGVIDAGVRAAMNMLQKNENASIAVMATAGTVSSKGYVNTIRSRQQEQSYTGEINVFQQAGIGLAGAIDGAAEFISADAKAPRKEYRGPSDIHPEFSIDMTILDRYNFDWSDHQILYDGEIEQPGNVQINSVNNYIAYHLVSLLEKIRTAPQAQPLKMIILGCTHYPFYADVFKAKLNELSNYAENGEYIYRPFMAEHIELVDPAHNTAKELYDYLREKNLFNQTDISKSEFYISVPNRLNIGVRLDSAGNFQYDYKYGRQKGDIQQYVKRVPFSKITIPAPVAVRLEKDIALTFALIQSFNRTNPKMAEFDEQIKF